MPPPLPPFVHHRLTRGRLSINVWQVGMFLALLGFLVLPANLLVGESSDHEDRTIIVTSQVVTTLGLLLVISYWGEYTEAQVGRLRCACVSVLRLSKPWRAGVATARRNHY